MPQPRFRTAAGGRTDSVIRRATKTVISLIGPLRVRRDKTGEVLWMKEPHVKGLATHDGPESCEASRKGSGEALTGVGAGRVFSRESGFLRDADAVGVSGRQHLAHRYREMRSGPARSEPPCTYGNTSHENREVLCSPTAGSRWSGSGIAPCRGAARTAGCYGTECCGLLTAGCPFLASIIPTLCAASALSPEARAGCGNTARPDLLRGLWATMIPTRTSHLGDGVLWQTHSQVGLEPPLLTQIRISTSDETPP